MLPAVFLTSPVWLKTWAIFPGLQWGVLSKPSGTHSFPHLYWQKHIFSCLDAWSYRHLLYAPHDPSVRYLKGKATAVPFLCVTFSLILLVFLWLFSSSLRLQCFLYWWECSCWSLAERLFPVNYSASAPLYGAFLYCSHIALLNIFMINNSV